MRDPSGLGAGARYTRLSEPFPAMTTMESPVASVQGVAALRSALHADAARIVGRYPEPRSALLPLLHLVQAEEGYVSREGIAFCAQQVGLSETEVTAVVSYYTMYKRQPVGDYHVGVCTNTVCAVLGGDAIFASLQQHLGIGDDETTADGSITLEHLQCNAACDYAPVVMVNWEFFDDMTPQRARDLVDGLRAGADIAPSRGAPRLCTWKQAARILAGFPDGQAAGGRTAGHATLAGLRIARSLGWQPGQVPDEGDAGGDGG